MGHPAVDWDNTLRFCHTLWDQGLGLAEAMDTAQRGIGATMIWIAPLTLSWTLSTAMPPLPRSKPGAGRTGGREYRETPCASGADSAAVLRGFQGEDCLSGMAERVAGVFCNADRVSGVA